MSPLEISFWFFLGLAPIINIILICVTLRKRKHLSRRIYGTMILISLGLIVSWSSAWDLPRVLVLGYLFPVLILIFFVIRSTYDKKPWKKIFKKKSGSVPKFFQKNKNIN